jgi:hypothetical protein
LVHNRKVKAWVEGVPTKGAIDGRFVQLDAFLQHAGSKTYGTAIGGSNTIHLIRPHELQGYELERAIARVNAATVLRAQAEKPVATSPLAPRTWSDSTGQFTRQPIAD